MTELTDLEGATLAVIGRHGPTTSYAVAKNFADSPSEFWSGSAGSVYPLIKRLEERGYLSCEKNPEDKRGRTDYSLTAEGRVALKQWLLDAKRAAGIGFDPLRTRVVYLDMVTAKERAAFMSDVRTHFEQFAKQAVWPESPRLQQIHATVIKARRAWLKMLKL